MGSQRIRSSFVTALMLVSILAIQAQTSRETRAQPTQPTAARMEILVPAYFYPGSDDAYWPAMTRAAARVPVTAILNPNSGPGDTRDSNYVTVVNELRAAGGQVIAYIHTSYTERPLDDVIAELHRYQDFYEIDGFFIDEMSNQAKSGHLTYYQNLYNYIKGMAGDLRVIGNPGINTVSQYLSLPAADVLVNFESGNKQYGDHEVSDWVYRESAQKFAHLVYKARFSHSMRRVIANAMRRNAGLVYVTDDTLDNPWDRLPRYWEKEVDCIEKINAGSNQC